MGFEFVEDALDFPPLRVSTGEFGRAGLVGVEDGRQQPIVLGIVASVVDRVVDDADIQRRCAGAVCSRGGHDAGQPGPVGQCLDMARPQCRFHAPQQVSTGPGTVTLVSVGDLEGSVG